MRCGGFAVLFDRVYADRTGVLRAPFGGHLNEIARRREAGTVPEGEGPWR